MALRYVSIDIETTGLEPDKHQVIEFAAVASTGEEFNTLVAYKELTISPFVAVMHQELLKRMATIDWDKLEFSSYYSDEQLIVVPSYLAYRFGIWLTSNHIEQPITAAGKNFSSFDLRFLRRIMPGIKFHHRALDPAVFYLRNGDTKLPNLATCCERAGIEWNDRHTALADARVVVKLLEKQGLL